MANEILHKVGTPVVFADVTDYSSSGSGFTRTAQILLESVATGAARQSDKVDLGATRARMYGVLVGIEFGTAPTAGGLVEFYWSASHSATAGTGNDAGASGSDAAYKAAEEDEWKKQAILMGVLIVTNDGAGTVQRQTIGYFTPPERYGQIIVVNKAGQTFDTDSIQMYVALVPIVDEVQ